MLESEKHFSSLLFERCGTASAAVAVLLETHVAAACSLWFHPDPDLHCNEHSGQSIIHRRFTHSKKGKTNRSAMDTAGKGSRSIFCRYMKLCCEACLFCLSQFREGKVPWADTVCLRGVTLGLLYIPSTSVCWVFLDYRSNQCCLDSHAWWMQIQLNLCLWTVNSFPWM